MWPAVVQTESSKETEAEAKLVKELFAEATEIEDTLHQVLGKHGFWKTTCHVMNFGVRKTGIAQEYSSS